MKSTYSSLVMIDYTNLIPAFKNSSWEFPFSTPRHRQPLLQWLMPRINNMPGLNKTSSMAWILMRREQEEKTREWRRGERNQRQWWTTHRFLQTNWTPQATVAVNVKMIDSVGHRRFSTSTSFFFDTCSQFGHMRPFNQWWGTESEVVLKWKSIPHCI